MRRRLFAFLFLLVALLVSAISGALPVSAQRATTATTAPTDESSSRDVITQPVETPEEQACGIDAEYAAPAPDVAALAEDMIPESRLLEPGETSMTSRAELQVTAVPVGGDARFGATSLDNGVQVVGTMAGGVVQRVHFEHSNRCSPGGTVELELHEDGAGTLIARSPSGATDATVHIGTPWATTKDGAKVPTWFEADGSTLIQVVDATGIDGEVVFDPQYYLFACRGHFSDLTAYQYIDFVNPDPANGPACSVTGLFRARLGYDPKWGYDAHTYNDYGYVVVKENGECSDPIDDDGTGLNFDFQVACRAHDYCYDLRRAGFSGTVSDYDCDEAFEDLMNADCNDRSLLAAVDCHGQKLIYRGFVGPPTAGPSPASVKIQNLASLDCADVEGPSTANGAPLQQWDCLNVTNQRFKIWPAPNAPGYFQIKSDYSGKCIRSNGFPVIQQTCDNTSAAERWKIQGALNVDQYSIRGGASGYGTCWKVPNTTTNGTDILFPPPCIDWDYWYIWRFAGV